MQADPAGPCLITVSGELDYHTGPQLRAYLDDAPCESGLVLDLSGITYCDSTGVSVLVHAYRRTEGRRARCSRWLARLLRFSGCCLSPGWTSSQVLYNSVDTAVHALSA